MPTGSKEWRHCRTCGGVPVFNAEGCCLDCMNHPAPHVQYGQFNARCVLCWADMWRAIPRSIYFCPWRLACKLRRWCSGARP